MSAQTRATLQTEPAANRDGTITWIARGTAGGIPYIAEGDTEADALAEAAAVVFEAHAKRRLAALVERDRHTGHPPRRGHPAMLTGDPTCQP